MKVSHLRAWSLVLLPVWTLGAARTGLADPPRARALQYDSDRKSWVELPPPPPGSAEGALHDINVLIHDGHARQALKSVKRFVERFGSDHLHYPGALIAKAKALIGRRDFAKAHEVLQAFLNEYSGTGLTLEALRLEFVIAETFLSGVKRKILGLRLGSGEDLAFEILDEISIHHANTSYGEHAVKTKADYLFDTGEHGLAEQEYARLLQDWPNTQYHRFAARRLADSALASYSGVDYDEAAAIEAAERYRDYRARYGAIAEREGVDLILAGIEDRLAEKELAIGDYYERTGHLSSAVMYYRSTVDRWGETTASARARRRLELLVGLPESADVAPARTSQGSTP